MTVVLGVTASLSVQAADKNPAGATSTPVQGGAMAAPTTPGGKPKSNVINGVKVGPVAISASDCTGKKGGTVKDGRVVLEWTVLFI